LEIKVSDLVFYHHAKTKNKAYGVISRITGSLYWSYYNNDNGKEFQCSKIHLTKVGPRCLGVWYERD
jgi:hypothetical protein